MKIKKGTLVIIETSRALRRIALVTKVLGGNLFHVEDLYGQKFQIGGKIMVPIIHTNGKVKTAKGALAWIISEL